MTAPEQRATGLDPSARGLIVLVVAVAIGLLLLLKAGDSGGTKKVSTGSVGSKTTVDVTTTTTKSGGSTTTTGASSSSHTPAEVKVLVLNGSGKAGVAKSASTQIGTKGYTMGTPGNAAANVATTSVYYAAGYQADADAIAALLGKDSSIVVAKPATALGPGADTANVVVVLGADTPAGSTSSSTTTVAGSSSTTSTTSSGTSSSTTTTVG